MNEHSKETIFNTIGHESNELVSRKRQITFSLQFFVVNEYSRTFRHIVISLYNKGIHLKGDPS